MPEPESARTRLLDRLREKRRPKSAPKGDTPQAQAERRRPSPESDEDKVKRRVGNGVIFS
jgi:hypothetical protein